MDTPISSATPPSPTSESKNPKVSPRIVSFRSSQEPLTQVRERNLTRSSTTESSNGSGSPHKYSAKKVPSSSYREANSTASRDPSRGTSRPRSRETSPMPITSKLTRKNRSLSTSAPASNSSGSLTRDSSSSQETSQDSKVLQRKAFTNPILNLKIINEKSGFPQEKQIISKAVQRIQQKKILNATLKILQESEKPNLCLELFDNTYYLSRSKEAQKNKQNNIDIIDFLCAKIMGMLPDKVTHFFDDTYKIYSLSDIISIIEGACGPILRPKSQSPLRDTELLKQISDKVSEHIEYHGRKINLVSKELKEKYQAQVKDIETNLKELQEKTSLVSTKPEISQAQVKYKEIFCYILMLYFRPIGSISNDTVYKDMLISPDLLLLTYPKLVSTEQLFHLGSKILELPIEEIEDGYRQKMRLLEFFFRWSKSMLYQKKHCSEKVKNGFLNLKNSAKSLQSKEVNRIIEEIEVYFYCKPITPIFRIPCPECKYKTMTCLSNLIYYGPSYQNFEDNILIFSKEIKNLIAQLYCKLTPTDIITTRKSSEADELGKFHTGLSGFVAFIFSQLSDFMINYDYTRRIDPLFSQLSPKEENELSFNCAYFFISLAHTLVKNFDFLSSHAIYIGIPSDLLDSIFNKKEIKKVNWIPKGKLDDFINKYNILERIFDPNCSFWNIHLETKECQKQKAFSIPHLTYRTKMIQKMERIKKNEVEKGKIDFEYHNGAAQIILGVDNLLQDIRSHVNNENHFFETDIREFIVKYSSEESIEEPPENTKKLINASFG